MIVRRLLLIGNPGLPNEEEYCGGVEKDIHSYRAFFLSPEGGYWSPTELQILRRPSAYRVEKAIRGLARADYSIVVFCGHGDHVDDSTYIDLGPDTMDSDELRTGRNRRQTIILDCCRTVRERGLVVEDLSKAMMMKAKRLDGDSCRLLYDQELRKCEEGVVIACGCKIGEQAEDSSAMGGLYPYSLLRAAVKWSKYREDAGVMSVVGAHHLASENVKRVSRGLQSPQIRKSRGKHVFFPFCVVA